MDRTKTLLSLFDSSGFGLEIGPSYSPLLPKSAGYNVETVDHADAAALREKYKDNASQIEEVDYVSDGRSLLDLIGQPEKYDYIVASHMIEHVTDIIRFLQDCETLLKPDGKLLLVVPDKRFCFDALRPLSTVGEALTAFDEKRTRHSPGTVFDFLNSFVKKGGTTIWADTTLDDMELAHEAAGAKGLYDHAKTSPDYIDVHAWRFTPSHFRLFVKTLRSLGFIKSGQSALVTNDDSNLYRFEFYVTLAKNAPVDTMADLDLHRATARELHEIVPAATDRLADDRLMAALKRSISWRLIRPLRQLKSRLAR